MPTGEESVFDEVVNCVIEFLEAAVHTTLWARKLYSPDLFERAKYCGFNARRSRHPGLNHYISSVLAGLKALIKKSFLQEVAVVFFDVQGSPIDRVTFDIQLAAAEARNRQPTFDIGAIESAFTSALLVLSCTDSFSKPLPQGSTFEILAYSTSREGVDMNLFAEDSTQSAELPQPIAAHALKSILVEGCLRVQVLLEQAGAGRSV